MTAEDLMWPKVKARESQALVVPVEDVLAARRDFHRAHDGLAHLREEVAAARRRGRLLIVTCACVSLSLMVSLVHAHQADVARTTGDQPAPKPVTSPTVEKPWTQGHTDLTPAWSGDVVRHYTVAP